MKECSFFRAIAAVNIKDFQTALSTIEEGIKAIPDNLPFREAHVELLLGRMHDFEAGWIVLARLARNAIEKNDGEWLLAAMQQLFGSPYDYSCLPFAERFSMGKELLRAFRHCVRNKMASHARVLTRQLPLTSMRAATKIGQLNRSRMRWSWSRVSRFRTT
ncbi:hypothetical protein [Rhizobium beringeri]|uniref:hypothetical protein n=1 Tax=Rhizobium beringeri TaxID=3019934 RepID=UPI002E0E4473|nr:hypothetical protein U8P69_33135 [Rhizobium beringeri]